MTWLPKKKKEIVEPLLEEVFRLRHALKFVIVE